MIKAILFDADNTIYNTSDVAVFGDMAAMRYFSTQIDKSPQALYAEWKAIVGKVKRSKSPLMRSRKYSYSLLAKKYGLIGVDKACELSIDTVIKRLSLKPGFKNALLSLKGVRLGIITEDSGASITKKLARFGLSKRFGVIVTSDKTKIMKPSKIYYQLALKKLRLKPKDCVVVGDSFEKDLSIPKRLGCLTILFGDGAAQADLSLKKFSGLAKIIKKHNSAE